MNPYRAIHLSFWILVTSIVLLGSIRVTQREIFPFFSWALFADVPDRVEQAAIVITHVDGEALLRPMRFQEALSVVTRPHSVVAYHSIQDLARSWSTDTRDFDDRRLRFERQFLKPGMKYALVIETARDPIDARKGIWESLKVLGEFVVDRGGS
jgi:hypothetical protein